MSTVYQQAGVLHAHCSLGGNGNCRSLYNIRSLMRHRSCAALFTADFSEAFECSACLAEGDTALSDFAFCHQSDRWGIGLCYLLQV